MRMVFLLRRLLYVMLAPDKDFCFRCFTITSSFPLPSLLSQNFPGRSAPIKEQTVAEYLLEAAQEGLPFDWTRFCEMIGLTQEIMSEIQGAILKVGSADKLKPIKNELPEDVSLNLCPI